MYSYCLKSASMNITQFSLMSMKWKTKFENYLRLMPIWLLPVYFSISYPTAASISVAGWMAAEAPPVCRKMEIYSNAPGGFDIWHRFGYDRIFGLFLYANCHLWILWAHIASIFVLLWFLRSNNTGLNGSNCYCYLIGRFFCKSHRLQTTNILFHWRLK